VELKFGRDEFLLVRRLACPNRQAVTDPRPSAWREAAFGCANFIACSRSPKFTQSYGVTSKRLPGMSAGAASGMG
jgi:hypothetical protein